MLIIATNSKDKYSKEYKECLIKIKTMLPGILIKSNVGLKQKLKMAYIGVLPIMYAKICIYNSRKKLAEDTME